MTTSSTPSNSRSAIPLLKDLLDLEQLDLNLFRSRVSQRNPNGTLFGGQILGQALRAAALTVVDRRVHSLHGYFLLPGSAVAPVIYDVEMTRDGGSFSTRRVVARQRARTIFSMEASFHKPSDGIAHESRIDISVPAPEELPDLADAAAQYSDQLSPEVLQRLQIRHEIEIRPLCFEDLYLRKPQTTRALYWIRAASRVPDDDLTQLAGLAYLSDWLLSPAILTPHVPAPFAGKHRLASLDHAMWFHYPCHVNDWLLVDVCSPFATAGRGLIRGEIYDRNLKRVASVAQEALVRLSQSSG